MASPGSKQEPDKRNHSDFSWASKTATVTSQIQSIVFINDSEIIDKQDLTES